MQAFQSLGRDCGGETSKGASIAKRGGLNRLHTVLTFCFFSVKRKEVALRRRERRIKVYNKILPFDPTPFITLKIIILAFVPYKPFRAYKTNIPCMDSYVDKKNTPTLKKFLILAVYEDDYQTEESMDCGVGYIDRAVRNRSCRRIVPAGRYSSPYDGKGTA